MSVELEYLEGKKFCVVFVRMLEANSEKVQLRCMHGRASIENRILKVHCGGDQPFQVPNSALGNILPSDGTDLLKDCEYYVMVKVHKDIDLATPEY